MCSFFSSFSQETPAAKEQPHVIVDAEIHPDPNTPPPAKATVVIAVNPDEKDEALPAAPEGFVWYQATYSWKRSDNIKLGRAGKPKGKPKLVRLDDLAAPPPPEPVVVEVVEETEAPPVPVLEAPAFDAPFAALPEVVVETTVAAYVTAWNTYKDNDQNQRLKRVGLRWGRPYRVTEPAAARGKEKEEEEEEEEELESLGEAPPPPPANGKKKLRKKYTRYIN
jgi:hypothetical protein